MPIDQVFCLMYAHIALAMHMILPSLKAEVASVVTSAAARPRRHAPAEARLKRIPIK
jgi:hypothetical protein